MIELKVEPYCRNCVCFKPEASTVIAYYNGYSETTTTVTCKSEKKCKAISDQIHSDLAEKKSEQ